MKARDLDRRLTFLRATVTEDAFNEPVETWAPVASVWGSKRDVSDSEKLMAMQVGASVTTRFVIRWASSVAALDPKDRLECDGRLYDVTGIKEIGRRKALEITATARLA